MQDWWLQLSLKICAFCRLFNFLFVFNDAWIFLPSFTIAGSFFSILRMFAYFSRYLWDWNTCVCQFGPRWGDQIWKIRGLSEIFVNKVVVLCGLVSDFFGRPSVCLLRGHVRELLPVCGVLEDLFSFFSVNLQGPRYSIWGALTPFWVLLAHDCENSGV